MLKVENVEIESKSFEFIHLEMPAAPILILKGKKGFVMCGYLNIDAAEKLGDFAVRAPGVRDLDTLLDAEVAQCTSISSSAGVETGMKVREILRFL